MAAPERSSGREGLSIQTLVIAAAASAAAAIVTSTFWHGGAIIAAAMTPVIVSIVKELLARPIESDLVRRPVQAVRSGTGTRRFERRREARVPSRVGAPPRREPDELSAMTTPGDRALGTTPIRTYGGRRRLRVGVAVATGIVAFAIAIVALTVPELIFGGSVASHGGTTLFGGHSSKTRTTTPKQTTTTGTSTSTSPTRTSPTQGQTSTTPEGGKGQTSTSQQTTPAPSQQAPPAQQQAPAPSQQAPPASGTPPAK